MVTFDQIQAWPCISSRVTQLFGANPENYAEYGYPGHNGLDLAAPLDSPFFAAWPGKIIWASNTRQSQPSTPSAYGYHIKIDHGNGLMTLYAHAGEGLEVEVGDHVDAGQTIAYSGNTGNSTGPHLHFEIRLCPGVEGYRECQRDPLDYMIE